MAKLMVILYIQLLSLGQHKVKSIFISILLFMSC